MKIKTGDKVKMLIGKDRGKTGKVLQVFVTENRVVVEGLNLHIKHQRPKKQGEKGQRIQFPGAVNLSNVAVLCPKCGRATRTGSQIIKTDSTVRAAGEKGAKNIKNRICKKCNEVI